MTDDPVAGCLVAGFIGFLMLLFIVGVIAIGLVLFAYSATHCCGINIPDPTPPPLPSHR